MVQVLKKLFFIAGVWYVGWLCGKYGDDFEIELVHKVQTSKR